MSKMEFLIICNLNIQNVRPKSVLIDHPELPHPKWLPRSVLSTKSDDDLIQKGRSVDELEVDKWFVLRESLEELMEL